MSATARAATLFGAQDLRVVERDLGALAPGMVRVRFSAGGICGSDLHYFRHGRTGDFVVRSPLVLGHEVAGEIAEIGGGVQGLTVGQAVAINPARWCGTCARCAERRPNLCENVFMMGSASKTPHMQGGFSTAFDVHPAQCVPVSAALPASSMALCEPLAVALHAVARAGSVAGRHAAVIGAGPIGLLVMMAARHRGAARVCVADVASAPLAFAEKLGADQAIDVSDGGVQLDALAATRAIDVVFEVSGTAAGFASAIRSVRRGGTVVQVGNLPGGDIAAPLNAVMVKELDLRGAFRFGEAFGEAVELIAAGDIDVAPLVTARLPLSDAPDAFRLALDRARSMKVILTAD